MPNVHFSIVLPVLAKEDHIDRVVREHEEGLKKYLHNNFEIIVAVNGDAALTEESTVRIVQNEPRITEIRLKKAGWGRAIKAGFDIAQGDLLCYTNTAYAPVSEVIKVLRYAELDENALTKGSRVIRENKARKWVSFVYNLENLIILKTPVLDVNAAPKIISRKVLNTLPSLEADDGMIDAELIYKCHQAYTPIVEVPIFWGQRISGKSNTTSATALHLAIGLITFRFRQWRQARKLPKE